MPLLYGLDEELSGVAEGLSSEEILDELSESPSELLSEDVSSEELSETLVTDELVLVELELFVLPEFESGSDTLSSPPELLQPPSSAVIIKAAVINKSFFFMTAPLP